MWNSVCNHVTYRARCFQVRTPSNNVFFNELKPSAYWNLSKDQERLWRIHDQCSTCEKMVQTIQMWLREYRWWKSFRKTDFFRRQNTRCDQKARLSDIAHQANVAYGTVQNIVTKKLKYNGGPKTSHTKLVLRQPFTVQ